MAARKVIQKLTHNEANVKVTNATADNVTITLNTDLKLSSETLGTPKVNIDKIFWSVSPVAGASITITRDSVAIATLYGSGELNLNANGMTDDEKNVNDILVTIAGTGGSVYLKLKKVEGYGD